MRITDRDIDRIRDMLAAGVEHKAIAQAIGCSRFSINQVLTGRRKKAGEVSPPIFRRYAMRCETVRVGPACPINPAPGVEPMMGMFKLGGKLRRPCHSNPS